MSRIRITALVAAVLAAVALAVALGAERLLHMPPCALCLVERWPYRIALVICVLMLALPQRLAWALGVLLCLAFVAGAAVAFVHVGVEQHWWPSPLPECAAPRFHGGSIAHMLANMPLRPDKPCDDPTYPIAFIPVSFAQANLLYALFSAAFVAIWGLRRPRG